MKIFTPTPNKRRFFVPEIIQTSMMDCGPASLKALLEGYGVAINYGRLREACQTDVDGTSIDTIEDIACDLGLDAIQLIVPADHLLLTQTDALPALVVIRLPNGLTHFVVAWRTVGQFVQVMDPSTGRSWWPQKNLLNRLYIHSLPVADDFAYEWITSDDFILPLRFRLSRMELNDQLVEHLIESAIDNTNWQVTAALDAATRITSALLDNKGIESGNEAKKVLEHFFVQASKSSPENLYATIPSSYWSIHFNDNQAHINGAVLISVDGVSSEFDDTLPDEDSPSSPTTELSRLQDPEPSEEAEIYRLTMMNGSFAISTLIATMTLTSLGIFLEAFLLKGLIDFHYLSDLLNSQMQFAQSVYFFFCIRFLLIFSAIAFLLYMGRWFEIHLRLAILKKMPGLGDRYFHSRLTSDMAQRVHEIRQLRELPYLGANYFKTIFEILLTTVGIIWIWPANAGITIFVITLILSISFFTQPILKEKDMSFRTHIGAMNRFYLDALLGLIPVRTHCAEKAVQNEHEVLQVKWRNAGRIFFRTHLVIWTIEFIIIIVFAIQIVFQYVKYSGEASGVLLLIYWIMKLPVLIENLTNMLQQYPIQRNRLLRLLEIIHSKEDTDLWYDSDQGGQLENRDSEATVNSELADSRVRVEMNNVSVYAGGHIILKDIYLKISQGEHIAIVGPSGAGKSSLVGLLLGFHRPFSGTILVDNQLLQGEHLKSLRRDTAWLDPSIQLWNRSMTYNLCYGNDIDFPSEMLMEDAKLNEIVNHLPHGMNTVLGENGGLLSGGEGQRVRLGRAMSRSNIRMAILDEPFRGLDRDARQELLKKARNHWKNATLLFISHDIAEALSFDRVLVVENAKIIENDNPGQLMKISTSRYRSLYEAEQNLHKDLWKKDRWKRWLLKKGELV